MKGQASDVLAIGALILLIIAFFDIPMMHVLAIWVLFNMAFIAWRLCDAE